MALAALYGISVILPDTNKHKLLDLLLAVDASLADIRQGVGSCRIQSDDANGSANVYVGDANISISGTLRYAYRLQSHDAVPLASQNPGGVPLGAYYVQGDTTGSQLNIELTL